MSLLSFDCRSNRERDPEKGAFIVLATIFIIAILLLSGLFIDSTNATRRRQRLQKATDAAVYAALARRVEAGPINNGLVDGANACLSQNPTGLMGEALSLAEYNLQGNNFDTNVAGFDICLRYESVNTADSGRGGDESFTANASYPSDVLLLDVVPVLGDGMGTKQNTLTLNTTASANLQPANVVLVLDVSSSMSCSGSQHDAASILPPGACTCTQSVWGDARDRTLCTKTVDCVNSMHLNNPTLDNGEAQVRVGACLAPDAAPTGTNFLGTSDNRKIRDLEAALTTFLGRFNSQRDRIALVAYNIRAQPLVSFRPIDANTGQARLGFDPQQFTNAIRSDQFINPRSMSNPSDGLLTASELAQAAGLFGDETVSYVLFSDGAPTAGRFFFSNPNQLTPNRGSEVYDYIHYEVSWQPPLDFDGSRAILGPSKLIDPGNISLGTLPEKIDAGDYARCGNLNSGDSRFDDAFSQCLFDLGYHLPGDVQDKLYERAPSFTRYKETYYHAVVGMADYVRANRGLVYSIGLGQQADVPATSDAYQNLSDNLFRKDGLLARAAFAETFDISRFRNFRYSEHGAESPPSWRRHHRQQPRGASWRGVYDSTQESERLSQVFTRIAKKILVRLVN